MDKQALERNLGEIENLRNFENNDDVTSNLIMERS